MFVPFPAFVRLALCLGATVFIAVPAQTAAQTAAASVRYEDHGAVGDGVADDFAALLKAHEFANQKKLPVRAKDGATYRIGGPARTIPIETDTDFGKAKFIIDDSNLDRAPADVFVVRSTLKPLSLSGVTTLRRQQTRIEAKLPGPCVILAVNKKVKQFIRRGNNANDGSAQTDVFLVNADGVIAANTPIIWNFDHISSLTALPLDAATLTVKGGHFTTIANRVTSEYNYLGRGIGITRSRVIIDGVQHYITGEGESGAPYGGFISVSNCANVIIRNSVFTAHKTYRTISRTGKPTSMGTYDLSFNRALNLSVVNCRQSNDILSSSTWGIMGSNFCKNLVYDRCQLSRFDAHQGVTHATIRDSVIGRAGLQVTGFGTLLVENTTVKSSHFINLRPDYGSTWTGEFIIRNCRFEPQGELKSPPVLIDGSNDGQHDFGYECQMPWRVRIDGLHVTDGSAGARSAGAYLLGNVSPRWVKEDYQQPFPYQVPREIHLKKINTTSGQPFRVSSNAFLFRNVKIVGP
jgi:hypothetical protein